MKIRRMIELQRCCICGKTFLGCGHNPWPVTNEGSCCDQCNKLTIQRRLMMLRQRKGE